MSVIRQAVAMFRRAWLAYGRPLLRVVRPMSEWTLPSGFAYDPAVDVIRDTTGRVLPNPDAYWVTDTVYIVPARATTDERVLTAAGIIPTGTLYVYVLPQDVATVRNAHAVEAGNVWYDVVEVTAEPIGTEHAWCRVELRRRS